MKYTFKSAFEPYIVGLIKQKRSDGFIYESGEYHLKKFDEFCVSFFPDAVSITHEIASKWANIRETEGEHYRNRRVDTLRQLSLYILSLGYESYVPRSNNQGPKPVLYIPSREEMSAFFAELDSWEWRNRLGKRLVSEYSVIFRLYYCCGLRLSEARLLKKKDVDFDKGILTILSSKGNKDRLVYLPPDGTQMLADYLSNIESVLSKSQWLFPGLSFKIPLSSSAIWRRFKNCWNRLPFAANTYKPPSPHCLRHAFVIERMNDWMRQGLNTQELLPYLSKYLGHKSPSETFYYYHLVTNAFAVIREKDTVSSRVIPEVMDYEEI